MASSSPAARGPVGGTGARRVFVVGVGMTRFEKPGKRDWDYPDMALIAGVRALRDANLNFREVQQVAVGYCYGDSTAGQRAVYQLGMTGVPVYNVNNNCATGSTALYMARQFIAGGLSDCVMALGFEKMEPGSLGSKFTDRTNPLDRHVEAMLAKHELGAGPMAPQMFGNGAVEHMAAYGSREEHYAKIAWKNHKHSGANPYSQFRDEYSLEQILASPRVHGPLTKLQCCPTSDGAAAAILASYDFVVARGLEGVAVEIIGQAMATDLPSTFSEQSCIKMVGADVTRLAAAKALAAAGVGIGDVRVLELHDCFSANELLTYEALGLAEAGTAHKLVDAGVGTYGSRIVIQPSGGLISKGHPLGATGLAQCAEVVWQLRGEAGHARQVPAAAAPGAVGMTHNLGLGGAAVVTVYRRPAEWRAKTRAYGASGGTGFGAGDDDDAAEWHSARWIAADDATAATGAAGGGARL